MIGFGGNSLLFVQARYIHMVHGEPQLACQNLNGEVEVREQTIQSL